MDDDSPVVDVQGDGVKAFASLIKDQLNPQDIKAILESQRQILLKLDATNRNLANSNQKSNEIFTTSAQRNYQVLSGRLILMKQDLDFVFKKIRQLKSKLEAKHPEQFSKAVQDVQAAKKQQQGDEEDEDEEEEHAHKPVKVQISAPPALAEETKERTASTGSGSSQLLAGFIEKARMGKDLVNGLIGTASSTPPPQPDEQAAPTDPAV